MAKEVAIPQWVRELTPEQKRVLLGKINNLLSTTSPLDTDRTTTPLRDMTSGIMDSTLTRRGFLGLTGLAAAALFAKKVDIGTQKLEGTKNAADDHAPTSINKVESKTIAWEAKEDLPYEENSELQVYPNHHLPGVINLLEKDDKTGEWIHYNNIVPVAKVGNSYSNAEIEKATITRSVATDSEGKKFARYQYPKMSNGAHFYADVFMENGKKEVKVALGINEDSARIDSITFANFLGIAKEVRYIKIDTKTLDARTYPDPNDGHFKIGRFYDYPLIGDKVEFWGPSGVKQYQKIKDGAGHSKYFSGEIRRRAWMPHMDAAAGRIGSNWWEASHIFVNNPTNGIVWTFGIEDSSTPNH